MISLANQLLSAAAAPTNVPQALPYEPFLRPLPVWGDSTWPWLLVPLCVVVAVVYKSIKCRYVRQVPREAFVLTLWIVGGMAVAAGVLMGIVEAVQWGYR